MLIFFGTDPIQHRLLEYECNTDGACLVPDLLDKVLTLCPCLMLPMVTNYLVEVSDIRQIDMYM